MATSTPKLILAADDSPDILDLIVEVLEAEEYRVTTTMDPLDVDAVKRVGPDLVILDRMLEEGEGSGWRLLEELRRDPVTARLPVVVCTGATRRVAENEALLRTLDARVVLKPFDIDDLLAAVAQAWQVGEGRPEAASAPSAAG